MIYYCQNVNFMDSGAKPMHLSDRHQRVLTDIAFLIILRFSEWGKIKHGVPQG